MAPVSRLNTIPYKTINQSISRSVGRSEEINDDDDDDDDDKTIYILTGWLAD